MSEVPDGVCIDSDPRGLAPGCRIAIVGSGISGLVAARELQDRYALTVFEAGDYVGGHTNTVDIDWEGTTYPVDTGFIVFNHRTYPNFVRLLADLGVASKPTTMSFGMHCAQSGLEYCGSSLGQMFAQRSNIFRPGFWWMIREILRFHRESKELLAADAPKETLGEYLARRRFSRRFIEHYIVPMGAAIWSASRRAMLDIPAPFFVRFFENHGMLSVKDRPTWRVVVGGSREYVRSLLSTFQGQIRLSTPVQSVQRRDDGVWLHTPDGGAERFDGVVLATHADTSLKILADASPLEREALEAFPYQENDAVLHVDDSVLPKRRAAWAAWNYRLPRTPQDRVSVTYDMNELQGIDAPTRFLVTLNSDVDIDPSKVLRRVGYHHPVFTREGIAMQSRHDEVSGRDRVWFCGAYWGFGFHEDGVKSGLAVAEQITRGAPSAV